MSDGIFSSTGHQTVMGGRSESMQVFSPRRRPGSFVTPRTQVPYLLDPVPIRDAGKPVQSHYTNRTSGLGEKVKSQDL